MTLRLDLLPYLDRHAAETCALLSRCRRAAAQRGEAVVSPSMPSRDSSVILALSDGRVVGSGGLRYDRIHSLCVEPALWRRGIGSRLMAALEAIARDRALEKTVLSCAAEVGGFYRRLGYRACAPFDEEPGALLYLDKLLQDPWSATARVPAAPATGS